MEQKARNVKTEAGGEWKEERKGKDKELPERSDKHDGTMEQKKEEDL